MDICCVCATSVKIELGLQIGVMYLLQLLEYEFALHLTVPRCCHFSDFVYYLHDVKR